jgi:paraquat-inducible protein B
MKHANPALIGGFILGAMALAVAGILIFGSGKFFSDTIQAVMYFDGAVQGLQVGAAVNFRGVRVGSVKTIKLQFNQKSFELRIPVIVEFPRDLRGTMQLVDGKLGPPQETLAALIERGLRAQLQVESLVTGLLFVQLDFYPEALALPAAVDPVTKLPEIPTVPTTLQEISHTMRKALDKLAELPLEQMVHDLSGTLSSIRELVDAPEIREALRNINGTMTSAEQVLQRMEKDVERVASEATDALGSFNKLATDAQQMVRSLEQDVGRITSSTTTTLGGVGKLTQSADTQIVALVASLKETAGAAHTTLSRTQETLAGLQQFTAPNSPVGYELVTTLQALTEAARSLRELTDYLARYPNSIVFGRSKSGGK